MKKYNLGFTLVELMVVVSVIGILSSIVYANFGSARAAARDDIRKSSLEEVRLALELYKAQYGRYPLSCRGDNAWSGANHALYDCATVGKDSRVYIEGLVPEFIAELPWDPNTGTNRGYLYRTGTGGQSYKLLAINTVERKQVTSYEDQYARCPAQTIVGQGCPNPEPPAATYAVYSAGAENY
jgi:prepilin-type N-terminal cleavage/methylation domain-containing protein